MSGSEGGEALERQMESPSPVPRHGKTTAMKWLKLTLPMATLAGALALFGQAAHLI
jgi:hypothetical protein